MSARIDLKLFQWRLLDRVEILLLLSWETIVRSSMAAALSFIPSTSAPEFPFTHTLNTHRCSFWWYSPGKVWDNNTLSSFPCILQQLVTLIVVVWVGMVLIDSYLWILMSHQGVALLRIRRCGLAGVGVALFEDVCNWGLMGSFEVSEA